MRLPRVLSTALGRRPRLSDQRGFTLVELLMASTIGLVILGSATLITIGAGRHNVEVAERTDATARGRIAMDRIVQVMRSQVCTTASTFPITTAAANTITFTADLGDGTRPPFRHTITYTPSTRRITNARVAGVATTPMTFPGATATQLLADGVYPGTGSFLRYFAYPTTAPSTGRVEPNIELVPAGTASLSAAQIARIARVDISFVTQGRTPKTQDIRAAMNDTVFLRIADPNGASTFDPSC